VPVPSVCLFLLWADAPATLQRVCLALFTVLLCRAANGAKNLCGLSASLPFSRAHLLLYLCFSASLLDVSTSRVVPRLLWLLGEGLPLLNARFAWTCRLTHMAVHGRPLPPHIRARAAACCVGGAVDARLSPRWRATLHACLLPLSPPLLGDRLYKPGLYLHSACLTACAQHLPAACPFSASSLRCDVALEDGCICGFGQRAYLPETGRSCLRGLRCAGAARLGAGGEACVLRGGASPYKTTLCGVVRYGHGGLGCTCWRRKRCVATERRQAAIAGAV